MNKYCRVCGKEVDRTTKKCTGCGKQYFSGKKFCKIIGIAIIFLSITLLSIASYNHHRQIVALKKHLATEQEKLDELETTMDFLDNRSVFTFPSGSAFHHLDCPYIQGKTLIPWPSASQAINEGYTPCTRCYAK